VGASDSHRLASPASVKTRPDSRSDVLHWVLLFCLGTFFYFSATYVYVPILSVYAASIGSSLTDTGLVVSAYGLT
jgi:predicted MFS family arabinose efflux permease